jgi:1-acyl-sn-glycerol-3-phosphate acyltransferase
MLPIFKQLRALMIALALTVNALMLPTLLVLTALVHTLLKPLLPQHIASKMQTLLIKIEKTWISINHFCLSCLPTNVICELDPCMRTDEPYLLIANHQSWADIPLLQMYLKNECPPLRFVLKQSLIFLPNIGPACWALGFPFIKRYSLKQMKQKPSRKQTNKKQLEKACHHLKKANQTIVIFAEGTRFNKRKRSPYQHLLNPQSSGVAMTAYHWQQHCQHVLDVTLHYQHPNPTFWELCCGNIPTITLKAQKKPLPQVMEDYYEHPETKTQVHQWLKTMWAEKEIWLQKKTEN